MENKIELWTILIPTVRNDGRFFRKRFHKVWDAKVRSIAGGLTVLTPGKGQWVYKDKLYEERVIPVMVACTRMQIEEIIDYTAKYYSQLSIFCYKVSNEVIIKNYEK